MAAAAGIVVGLVAAGTGSLDPQTFWFAVLCTSWWTGTLLVLWQPRPSLGFIAVQAWMALNVLNGAILAMVEGHTSIGPYNFTSGLEGGMRLSALAESGLVAGMLVMRAIHPASGSEPVVVDVAPARLDRLSLCLLGAGASALLLYVVASGAGLGSINVLSGGTAYGDLKREADGPVIGYLRVLTGLAGVAMMVAVVRLASVRRRSFVPVAVVVASALLLVASGGRSWLLVPVVASGLLWWRTADSPWARRPRRTLLLGGLCVFAIAVIVGGLRGQQGDKTVDPEAFVVKELRGGIFPTTAGLAESVPDRQPHLAGRSLLDVGTLVVPRALWPEKPSSALKEVQDGFMPKDIGASFGLQGELYANFGDLGVVVGAVVFAALLELCWLRFTEADHLPGLIGFSIAIPILIHLLSRGYLVTLLAGQLGTIVGAAIAAWYLGRWAAATGEESSSARRLVDPVGTR